MVKRIGILFNESESWAGGFYYLLNLIKALNKLSDEEKPQLTIYFSDPQTVKRIQELNYAGIAFKPIIKQVGRYQRFLQRILNRFGIAYDPSKYDPQEVDYIFPNNYYSTFPSLLKLKRIYWIPDFQHKYLPENFTADELAFREKQTELIIANNYSLILSSESAANDFRKYYPHHRNQVNVLPFCSILDNIALLDFEQLKEKIAIKYPYFVSPNQFWKHKNHMTLLKAINHLKRKGTDVYFFLTGNEKGNESYVNTLKEYIRENNLQENVVFLGFLDRSVQLSLLKYSLAVVQPSGFEGWSTVVEDTKALNKFVLLSGIPVHREQVTSNGMFFDPYNELELAACIEKVKDGGITVGAINYEQKIIDFARKITKLS